MDLEKDITIDADRRPPRATPRARRPGDGDVPGGSSARRILDLSGHASLAEFAAAWHGLLPEIPLIPLRQGGVTPAGGRRGSSRVLWTPLDGSWDAPPGAAAIASLLEGDPSLRVGLRLGRSGPGGPWLVDVLAVRADLAAGALRRLLGKGHRDGTATWQDEEGTHRLYLGDDRLAAIGRPVVGSSRGDEQYPGMEVRFGSADPADSLAVLPAAPRPGRRRNGGFSGERLLSLPDLSYADLAKHTATTRGIDAGTAGPPAVASKKRTARARPEAESARVGSTLALRPPDPAPEATPVEVGPPTSSSPGPLVPEDLEGLGAKIREHARAGDLVFARAMDHYSDAGKLLIAVKLQVGHGGFGAFIKEHCRFGAGTANNYMRIHERWLEVEALRAANRQPDAELTLKEVLKGLAGNRSSAGRTAVGGRPPAVVPAEDEDFIGVGGPARDDDGPRDPGRTPEPVRTGGEEDSDDAELADASVAEGATTVVEPVEMAEDGEDPATTPASDAGGLRALLAKHGHAEDYDVDAAAWHDLRPVVPAILARVQPANQVSGSFNYFVSFLARARSPEEWILCPACGGSGSSGPGHHDCGPCFGQGFRIDGVG